LQNQACGHRLNELASLPFARLGGSRAQVVFAKEIGQRLQSIRELLNRRTVLNPRRLDAVQEKPPVYPPGFFIDRAIELISL
jgi:hypothetical protein